MFDYEIWKKVGEGGCVDIQRGIYPNSVWALIKGAIQFYFIHKHHQSLIFTHGR